MTCRFRSKAAGIAGCFRPEADLRVGPMEEIMIGIDDNRFVMYEGQNTYGHAVWPQPLISRAKVIDSESDWKSPPHDNDRQCLVFREDTFDPLTRIRRG